MNDDAVREFARRFNDALERDAWGDIPPHLFARIASDDEPLDTEEASWRDSLKQCIWEAIKPQ
jgi:hypothetical protein